MPVDVENGDRVFQEELRDAEDLDGAQHHV